MSAVALGRGELVEVTRSLHKRLTCAQRMASVLLRVMEVVVGKGAKLATVRAAHVLAIPIHCCCDLKLFGRAPVLLLGAPMAHMASSLAPVRILKRSHAPTSMPLSRCPVVGALIVTRLSLTVDGIVKVPNLKIITHL